MKIAQKYSHLNGEEYLIVHHNKLYREIKDVIKNINANDFRTKVSKEKRKVGKKLFSPIDLNKAFDREFSKKNWLESRYNYYITLNRELMEKSVLMSAKEQKQFLVANGENEPICSYNQTDFVKEKLAVEVQFGKYSFVAYDLFVKHMLFYSGGVINLGIEILPTKKMQSEMSSGVAYYEGEVYNVMRQGRNNPPVPLLILGIEP
ncbi:MAG: restriction endonuclease [Bacteroidetes bacterium 4484_276]|nr:MAG: restriction endonuclease [Bacteroidetes bacterium 4484_276]OYT13640.1 MAG: restriction endonuclease [Bacteroidetes bacterium 4572_114]